MFRASTFSTAPDLRIFRRTTKLLEIDDGTDDGPGDLRLGGSFSAAYSGSPLTAQFSVDRGTGRVAIGRGAGSSNPFTVNVHSTSEASFIVGSLAFYLHGRQATSTSTLAETQAVYAPRAYYWNGSASAEVAGGMTLRATATGGGVWIWDVPNSEVVVFNGESRYIEVKTEVQADALRVVSNDGNLFIRAAFMADGARWGNMTTTADTRVQRTAAKTLVWDDAAGGALTLFKVTGAFEQTGNLGFYGTAAIAKQTGVAVTAAGIHAALVNLGLIAA